MSEHLTTAQLAELERLLIDERAQIIERAPVETILSGGVELGDERDPSDLQDRASQEVQQRDGLALNHRAQLRLGEIDAALERMREGTYGICEETGEPIPFGRLKLQPTTLYTVEALELLEEERAREALTSTGDDEGLY